MKNLSLLLILFHTFSHSQYSNYYNVDVNSNSNVNVNGKVDVSGKIDINKNVNVSGNINKTIRTIDYGALRLANAEKEKNRLESLKFENEKERNQSIEIATNPMKAFDYGTDNNWLMDKKTARNYGFSKGTTWYHKIPNKSLYVKTEGYNYRNESLDGVITEVEIGFARYPMGQEWFLESSKKEQKKFLDENQKYFGETEKYVKSLQKSHPIGEIIEDKYYTHKFDINKATVYGQPGFVWSWFYEDDYEYVIKDNYVCILSNGIFILGGARYKGDKDRVDFEMLEGRRSYLKRLNDQIIATVLINLGKKGLND
ncbi:hypothetical protein N9D55_06875 [Flavobacteriaceae bacterium]|nr:hypothetical protein [Flavobacteriaceae bacterium]